MKFQYASDLHLEFGKNSRYMQAHPLAAGGDVMLLAGDIAYLERRRLEQNPFFDWCADHFNETIIVPGNHEYYKDPLARTGHQNGVSVETTLMDYEHKVRNNVRYLNNRSMVIGDVEVFVTTLWTVTDPRCYIGIQTGMNDCYQILYDGHRLWADDFTKLHSICKTWLANALEKSRAQKKVVLTHHCPVTAKEFDRYEPSGSLYTAFHVDMLSFIEEHDIDDWIYGHTHYNGGTGTVIPSKNTNGTKLLCNQLGYVEMNEDQMGFRGDAIFQL